ncbi:mitochondrial import inner membrane translocase subunit tim21 [Ancistrocladus abbreviatus]
MMTRKDIAAAVDPFDSPAYHIPEKPVTFVEGASYGVIILVTNMHSSLLCSWIINFPLYC